MYIIIMCLLNPDFSNFSKHLFWDTDRLSLNAEKNKSYIVKQVLEFGYDKDWQLLKSIYNLDEIRDAVMGMRTLEKRALSFIACITHTDIRDFRCYSTKQSSQAPWIF
jgi:hypothetical protein